MEATLCVTTFFVVVGGLSCALIYIAEKVITKENGGKL